MLVMICYICYRAQNIKVIKSIQAVKSQLNKKLEGIADALLHEIEIIETI